MERRIGTEREAEFRPDGREQEGFGNLLRDLAQESADLVRQEANLAKLEMKETAAQLGKNGAKLAVAAGLAAAGGLALTACLVLVIGALLNGAYWAGALIVGAVFLLVGGVLAKRALDDMKRQNLAPEETIETLNEDKRWLRREVRDFRREALS